MKVRYGLRCGRRWRDRTGTGDLPPQGTTMCPGTLNRAVACSHSACPGWKSLPLIPKGYRNKRQVASCVPRQESCSVFCLERFASLLFPVDCMALLLKTASSADAVTTDASLQSPSLCFSPSCLFLLVISVASQICEKRLAFYRHRLPSTVLLSVFVG